MKIKNNFSFVAWEIVLLIASVFVFRGLWTLLDRVEWTSSGWFLGTTMAGALAVSGIAFWKLNRNLED